MQASGTASRSWDMTATHCIHRPHDRQDLVTENVAHQIRVLLGRAGTGKDLGERRRAGRLGRACSRGGRRERSFYQPVGGGEAESGERRERRAAVGAMTVSVHVRVARAGIGTVRLRK